MTVTSPICLLGVTSKCTIQQALSFRQLGWNHTVDAKLTDIYLGFIVPNKLIWGKFWITAGPTLKTAEEETWKLAGHLAFSYVSNHKKQAAD